MRYGETRAESLIRQGIARGRTPAEAVAQLDLLIGQPEAALGFIFCSGQYEFAALESQFQERFPDMNLVGCTTSGEVSAHGYTEATLTGVTLPKSEFRAASRLLPNIAEFQSLDGRAAVLSLIDELISQGVHPSSQNAFAFMFIDSCAMMEEQVASALGAALGSIPLIGGSAGDDQGCAEALVLHQGTFHRNAAVLTLVCTDRPFKTFCTNHFVGGGRSALVTGADPEHRLITELNGESAALEYARMVERDLNDLCTGRAPLPPLMVRVAGTYYARSPQYVRRDGQLILACAIDEGVPLSVGINTGMLANMERLMGDIRQSLGEPEVIIGVDCYMRRREALNIGIEPQLQRLFAENHLIGFSSNGEQYGGMHLNHTLTGVAIGSAMSGLPRPSPPSRPPTAASTEAQEALVGNAATPHRRLSIENAKLRKMVHVLLNRLERSMNMPSNTFSLFQNTVLLEETVRKRTAELDEVNRQLTHELKTRREIEAALLRAKEHADLAHQSKTQFLTALSHDLQQPLNAARLLLGTLSEDTLSPGGRQLVLRIENAMESTEEMLGDFLEAAKLEAGAVTCHPTDFPIGTMLAQLGSEYLPQASKRGLNLTIRPCSAVVRTDRRLLQRILRNLLTNALRYTQQGGVLLGCRRRGAHVSVEVWDTGAGIPAGRLEDVFRPFCQLHAGHDGDRSSGLGLTIVEGTAKLLGLPLDVRSQEGRGSVFKVKVPCGVLAMSAIAPPASGASEARALLSGKRVLAVDDNTQAVDSLRGLLTAWGCDASTVNSLEEAMEHVDPIPDIVIVDYHLGPDHTGLDVLERIAERTAGPIRGLVVSADRDIGEEVKRHGYEYLAKPLNPARLRSAMTYLLHRRSGRG